jgi:hypothetical protein
MERGSAQSHSGLVPEDDSQRTFKTQAATIIGELAQMRWLLLNKLPPQFPELY